MLSDGKSVTAESVKDLNTTFKSFVTSQENFLAALKECEIGSEDEESFNCMLEVLASDYESKGNVAYQAYYQSMQRFKQDALDWSFLHTYCKVFEVEPCLQSYKFAEILVEDFPI